MLAGVRHPGDFGGVVQHVAAAQAVLDEGPACVGNALSLQDLWLARTGLHLPSGKTQAHDLIRIVDSVAREVVAASEPGAAKDFDFEISAVQRMGMSLPTPLRQRQWALYAQFARWGTRLDLSLSSRAGSAAGRVAKGIQHLAQVLQGLLGLACADRVNGPASLPSVPLTEVRLQIIRSG
jgi:hypothetical protein